jgi:hypothetical protein
MKPVALPAAEGRLTGAAFSPDSNHLALVRNIAASGTSALRRVLQIIELGSGREVAHDEVLKAEHWDSRVHVEYSPHGTYLLLVADGSDVLSIIDASTLRTVKEVALHPETSSRKALAPSRYLRGVVALASPLRGDFIGAVTADALTDEHKVFIVSFSSGQILKSWGLGNGRVGSELGEISLSLSEDGSSLLVPVLPYGNSLPKGFYNFAPSTHGAGRW